MDRWRIGGLEGWRGGRMEGRKDGGHGGEWDSVRYGRNEEVLEKEKAGDVWNWDEGRQAGRVEARLCLSTIHSHHDASRRSN